MAKLLISVDDFQQILTGFDRATREIFTKGVPFIFIRAWYELKQCMIIPRSETQRGLSFFRICDNVDGCAGSFFFFSLLLLLLFFFFILIFYANYERDSSSIGEHCSSNTEVPVRIQGCQSNLAVPSHTSFFFFLFCFWFCQPMLWI